MPTLEECSTVRRTSAIGSPRDMADRPQQRAVESALLATAASLPFLPYILFLRAHPIPRFATMGDYAGLELATRFVWAGKTLLGPYSRYQFNHPGPLWYFLVAPVYRAVGSTTTGVFAGACFTNALSAAAIVLAVRLFTSRVRAIGVLMILLGWLVAFGDTCVQPWNPLTVVLPLIAFLVFSAFLARGMTAAAVPGALFGALACQTHLSVMPTVVLVVLASSGALYLGARERKLTRGERVALASACFIGFVLFLPPLIEEFLPTGGNVSKLAHFFSSREEPMKSFSSAPLNWALANSWLSDRIFSLTLLKEGQLPVPMSSVEVPSAASRYAIFAAVVTLALVFVSTLLAWRRRDRTSLALLLTSIVASMVAIAALRGVIGTTYCYLLFWVTAGPTVGLMGVASYVAGILETKIQWQRTGATIAVVGVVAGAAVGASAVQQRWLDHNSDFIQARSSRLADVYDELRRHVAVTGSTPVVHVEADWTTQLALLLELDRDGVDVRVEPRDRWMLGRQFSTPTGVARPIHVWSEAQIGGQLSTSKCLEHMASSSRLELWTAPNDVRECSEKRSPASSEP